VANQSKFRPPKRETNGGRQLISGEHQSQFLVGKKNRELTGVPDVPRDKNGADNGFLIS
jgi:hypothetical protein